MRQDQTMAVFPGKAVVGQAFAGPPPHHVLDVEAGVVGDHVVQATAAVSAGRTDTPSCSAHSPSSLEGEVSVRLAQVHPGASEAVPARHAVRLAGPAAETPHEEQA